MRRFTSNWQPAFTVGDFALFVAYLGWLTTITTFFGNFLAQ